MGASRSGSGSGGFGWITTPAGLEPALERPNTGGGPLGIDEVNRILPGDYPQVGKLQSSEHFAGLSLFFTPKYAVVKGLRYPNVGAQKMWVITKSVRRPA